MTKQDQSSVFLVGAGPGDPGLLSVRAKSLIEQADVVIYDYLANPVFLDYAGQNAELIYVGKKGGDHTVPQEGINQLIVDKARQGKTVVRLKGGDPFIFGRGGEEAEELAEAGIPFEIVPGITSAIAVPAYAGIPLTHRDYTATVAFVTGHEDPSKASSNVDWEKLSNGAGTLVFLMGMGNLPVITANLKKYGRPPETAVAVIHRGTTPEQRTVTGTLENIVDRVREAGLKPPAIILVGDVVCLREKLNWFEKKPLFGKRVIVTRAREQASGFLRQLTALGAECIQFPTIAVVPPEDWGPLDRAIQELATYQWLLFTSVNGVKFFFKRLEKSGKDTRALSGMKIGAIGPATAEALQGKGIHADLIPDEYRAEAVVSAFRGTKAKGLRFLLPRAEKAREILPGELRKMGATVDVVTAYRTEKPANDTGRIRQLLRKGKVDLITFTSSSTVTNFAGMFPDEDRNQFIEWMSHLIVACIGPITARTAEKLGFSVDIIPGQYTIDALTESIVRRLTSG
jgi:uroporphyrinogen III methyltransferase/synthase